MPVSASLSTAEFTKRAAIVIALALTPILVWLLFDAILIIIGAILFALLLDVVAQPFRFLRLPRGVALILSGILIASVLGGAGYLFGRGALSEMQEVMLRAEQAEKEFVQAMQQSELGRTLLAHVQGDNLPLSHFFSQLFRVSVSFVLGVLVAIFSGIFLAAQPWLYRQALLTFFPVKLRGRANETLDCISRALRLWLLGLLLETLIVGVLAGFAVWRIGVPSPLALGVISGAAEFVPYVGPILAIVPSVLVAATVNVRAMAWTFGAYILIHQIEGNLIMPIIQRQLIHIPPAFMLFSIVSLGLLFGPAGTIFAAPITVVFFVIVTTLYTHDTLDEAPASSGMPDS
ncbi:MAG: AI-2E family transporter [Methylocystis sp.]